MNNILRFELECGILKVQTMVRLFFYTALLVYYGLLTLFKILSLFSSIKGYLDIAHVS